jgi:hypothetical protein
VLKTKNDFMLMFFFYVIPDFMFMFFLFYAAVGLGMDALLKKSHGVDFLPPPLPLSLKPYPLTVQTKFSPP